MTFNTFAVVQPTLPSSFIIFPSPPQDPLFIFTVNLHSFSSSTNLFHVFLNLCFLNIFINGSIQFKIFAPDFLMFLSFIHVVACKNSSFIWLSRIPLYDTPSFVYVLTSWRTLGLSWFWWLWTKPLGTYVYRFCVNTSFHFFWVNT